MANDTEYIQSNQVASITPYATEDMVVLADERKDSRHSQLAFFIKRPHPFVKGMKVDLILRPKT